MSTFAGGAGLTGAAASGFVNGVGTSAKFNLPNDFCFGNSGQMFVVDRANNAIRKITSSGFFDVSLFLYIILFDRCCLLYLIIMY